MSKKNVVLASLLIMVILLLTISSTVLLGLSIQSKAWDNVVLSVYSYFISGLLIGYLVDEYRLHLTRVSIPKYQLDLINAIFKLSSIQHDIASMRIDTQRMIIDNLRYQIENTDSKIERLIESDIAYK